MADEDAGFMKAILSEDNTNNNNNSNNNHEIEVISEEAMRQNVVAQAHASALQQAEKKESAALAKGWSDVREAEEKMEQIKKEISTTKQNHERQRFATADISVLPHQSLSQHKATLSRLEFQLKGAERTMEDKINKLQKLQKEAQQQQQKRLEEAEKREALLAQKEKEEKEAAEAYSRRVRALQQQQQQQQATTTTNTTTAATTPKPKFPMRLPSSSTTTPTTNNNNNNTINNNNVRSASRSSSVPSSITTTAMTATSPYSPLVMRRAAYSGGAPLPSLSRVTLSRKDIKEKVLRYRDDGNVQDYVERLKKRKRLEMAEAIFLAEKEMQQQQEQQENNNNNVKTEGGEGEDSTAPPPSVKVKVEKTDDNVTVVSSGRGRSRGRASVKKEEEEEEAREKESKNKIKTNNNNNNGIATMEYFDVDALMEAEDETGETVVQSILQSANSHPLLSDDNNDNNSTKTNNTNKKRSRGRSASASSSTALHDEDNKSETDSVMTLEARYHALHLRPPPPVQLLPGLHLPQRIYTQLLPYQQEGLAWLCHLHARRCGGILGDEMGLGKTVQVAALLHTLYVSHQLKGPALIVAPMTILQQWVAELHRWAAPLRTCVLHESQLQTNQTNNNNSMHEEEDDDDNDNKKKKKKKKSKSPMTNFTNAKTSQLREALVQELSGTASVIVATYAALRQHCHLLQRAGIHYLILDEGHRISNPDAGITLAAKSFATPHRLILSGSPIQNTLKELWCLFDFVRPGLFGESVGKFVEEFEEPIHASKNINATALVRATAVACAETLQKRMAPYLLRRLKRQVNIHLPEKFERVLRVPLTAQQLETYAALLATPAVQQLFTKAVYYPRISGGLNREGRDASGSLHTAGRDYQLWSERGIFSKKGGGSGNTSNNKAFSHLRLESFKVMNQLRQICNHTEIFKVRQGDEEEEGEDYLGGGEDGTGARRRRGRKTKTANGTSMYTSFRSNRPVNLEGSAKLKTLLKMLLQWRQEGHRVLVFSQTRMMLDIIENLCDQHHFTYIRMDGTTNSHHRQNLVDRFNEEESIFVALLTTRVGGIGVNLTGADRVVVFDPDWNPVTDLQARERAWRIGQTRNVYIYRLISMGTLEEFILKRQLMKTYVTEKVLQDPALQHYFTGMGSVGTGSGGSLGGGDSETLIENFLLGEVYGDRLPTSLHHLLSSPPHQLHRRAGAGVLPQPTTTTTIENNNNNNNEHSVLDTAVEEILLPDTDNNNNKNNTTNGGVSSPNNNGAAAETDLLKQLIDGNDAAVQGQDAIAQRLAAHVAHHTLQRVLAAGPLRKKKEEEENKRRHLVSMTAVAEAQKAKERAEREEQRKFYDEELKRKREAGYRHLRSDFI